MESIGKYKITGALGEGGFGHVYKAEDPTFGRLVAIKVLNKERDESLILRFRAEAMTSASLRHKNIVTVFDFDEENGAPSLVMEYLDGKNLQQLIDRKESLGVLDKLNIMAEVAEGLQYAHERGVIHRDVKPANIMRLTDGSVKIMDFGIARLTQKNTRLTMAGYMVGTPEYMAPEQFESDNANAQCDVWAYGVVLYELLTGVNPFKADNLPGIYYKVANEDPPLVSARIPGLPASLDSLLRSLLAKRREDRYPGMEDVRLDLGPIIQELGLSEVGGMETYADSLIHFDKYDEAHIVLARILKYDPANTKARKWRQDLKDLKERRAREEQVRDLVRQANDKTTLLDYWGAVQRLQEALRLDPENATVKARLNEVCAEQEKKARAANLLAEARTDLERRALTSAFERATEACQTDPANADAAAFLVQIRGAIAVRDAEARRKSALSQARGLLLVQEFDKAVAVLQELSAQYPDDAGVRAKLQEALRLQAVDAAERRLAAAITESKGYLLNGEYRKAVDRLSALDAEAARNEQVQQLLAYACEQMEQQRRESEMDRILREADAAAAKSEYDAALAAVDRALELAPGNERALRLRKSIAAKRQREEESRVVEGELQACRKLMDSGRLEDAQPRLRELSNRHPEHTGIQEAVREIGVHLRRRRQAKEQQVESDRRQLTMLIDQGQREKATLLMQNLAPKYAGEDVFADLLARLRQMEQQQRESESVEGILARAREMAGESRWQEALDEIGQGLKLYPQSATLAAERERLLRELEIQQFLTEVRQRVANRHLDAAIAAAESGLRKFPGEPRLAALRQQAASQLEWQELLRRAEELILADRLEDAAKVLPELSRQAPGDAAVAGLQSLLEEKQQRRRSLQSADQFRKRFEFDQAREALRPLLQKDPADAAARAMLSAVERDSVERDRRQKVEAARSEAESLSKRKEYAAAVEILAKIAEAFPAESGIQEDLRRATQARDQAARTEAYARGRNEQQTFLRSGRFEEAIAKADELCAAFPEEPEAPENLRRAREAARQAARRNACQQGCAEADALIGGRQFEQAIAKLRQLTAEFPEEPEWPERLRMALGRQQQALRDEARSQELRELNVLMENRQYPQAIGKAKELIALFPDEPEFPKVLRAATEAGNRDARNRSYTQSLSGLDQLMRSGLYDQVILQGTELQAQFPQEATLQELMVRARAAMRTRAARNEACTRGRGEFETLMRIGRHDQAAAKARELIAAFPEEPDLPGLLRSAQDALNRAALREGLAQRKREIEVLLRNREFDRAFAKAGELAAAVPEDPEAQAELRRTREMRDKAARQQAYTAGRSEFERLLHGRQFERALARAEELAAAYPEEPAAEDDLKRARTARDQAARKEACDRGRAEFEALMRESRFAEAMQKATELISAFPEESTLRFDRKRAEESRDKAARQDFYDRGRRDLEALVESGQFPLAIEKADSLLQQFPGDPLILQDRQRAVSALDLRERGAELEAEIARIEDLFRKGDTAEVRKRAQAVLKKCDDPRARELLKWANQSQADLKTIRRQAGPRERRRQLLWAVGTLVLILLFAGIYVLLQPAGAIHLSADKAEIWFRYRSGDPLPPEQSFAIKVNPGVSWSVAASDTQWFRTTASTATGSGSVAVGITPIGLTAGVYSGLATVTAGAASTQPVIVRIKLTVTAPPEPKPPSQEVVQTAEKSPDTAKPPKTYAKTQSPPNTPAPVNDKRPSVSNAPLPVKAPDLPVSPPPPAAVDCHAANYGGLLHGEFQWAGTLQPQQAVKISRRSRATVNPAGRVSGDEIPGCAVAVASQTAGIAFTQPGDADNFSSVTVRNTGNAAIESLSFDWRVK